MKKIPVHFTHIHGGTLAHAQMDAVPRIGEQVNIGATTGTPKVFIVKNVGWVLNSEVETANHVWVSLTEADQ